jgi:monofunctional biosynthetic peptidoglycan transglycosylase
MVPNPRYYDRNRNTAWLARKTQMILARMPARSCRERRHRAHRNR